MEKYRFLPSDKLVGVSSPSTKRMGTKFPNASQEESIEKAYGMPFQATCADLEDPVKSLGRS
ncbi:hypothetical protein KHA80_00720 [Anaerobacillus sp. HL2]|nr:hypothetical protein KHA80_00720 [Anaerobacillus sp. HL2]